MEKRCKNCGSTKLYRNEDKWVCSYCGCKMSEESQQDETKPKKPETQSSYRGDNYIKTSLVWIAILSVVAVLVTVAFVVIVLNVAKKYVNNSQAYVTVAQSNGWYHASSFEENSSVATIHPITLDKSFRAIDMGNGSIVQGSIQNTADYDVCDVTIMIYSNGGNLITTVDKIAAHDSTCVMLVTKAQNITISKVICVVNGCKEYVLQSN